MPNKPSRVVIVDRHTWYKPTIEREELAEVPAEVVLGWAETKSPPEAATQGRPASDAECERLSRITAGYVPHTITTEDEVIRMAMDADAILCVRANISARVMDALPKLRAVGRYGIGVDNIDIPAARERGLAVVNAPGFCAREVADHTLMFVLAASRRLMFLDGAMRRGHWARDDASPMPGLFTQTLGLIGFGQIGQEVAKRATPFGLKVIVYDPFLAPDKAKALGVVSVSLEELLQKSDYISLHAPLTDKTRHIISRDQLAKMKRTAFVINTSRGPLIDEPALITALQENRIGGAGLDVFAAEPLPQASPLLKMPNVLLTPHIGGLSDEGQELVRRTIARGVAEVLSGRVPKGPELHVPPGAPRS